MSGSDESRMLDLHRRFSGVRNVLQRKLSDAIKSNDRKLVANVGRRIEIVNSQLKKVERVSDQEWEKRLESGDASNIGDLLPLRYWTSHVEEDRADKPQVEGRTK